MSNIQSSMSTTTTHFCSYSQFSNGCRSGCIFTAREKNLTRNENQREKRQKQQNNKKQTKANISKKLHNLWQHKNGTNTLIKLIRLTEVTGTHYFIRTGASDLVFSNLRFLDMLGLNKKWYHWKKEFIKIGNLRVLNKQKLGYFFRTIWLV